MKKVKFFYSECGYGDFEPEINKFSETHNIVDIQFISEVQVDFPKASKVYWAVVSYNEEPAQSDGVEHKINQQKE